MNDGLGEQLITNVDSNSHAAAEAELQRAITLHRQGRVTEAIKKYRAVLKLVPDHFDALHLLGMLMHMQGQDVEALELVGAALRVKPCDPAAILNYGAILGQLHRYQEALTTLSEAISLQEENTAGATAYYNRAIVFQRLKREEEALHDYDRAIELRSSYPEALNNRAIVLKDLGLLEEALHSCHKAVMLKPNYAEAHNNRGIILQELDRLSEALASYDEAIRLVPTFVEALNNKGNALQALKRFEEALTNYDRAIDGRPDYAEAFNNRGNALKELRRFDEALTALDTAIALRPSDAEPYINRGTVLQELKRFDEAVASYDRAVVLKPESAEAHNNRGNALKELNRFGEAMTSYNKAIRLKPDYAEAFNNRAIELVELGRLAEAEQAIEEAIRLLPGKARYYRTRGDIIRYHADDCYLAAMEELARSLTSLSDDDRIELHFGLAKAYDDLGRHEASFEQLLQGNVLRRQQIAYDEAKTLGLINQTRRVFTSDFIGRWANRGNESSIPIFIIGMPRSGSTLVEQILASHPQVFGGGELKYLPQAAEEVRMNKLGGSAATPSEFPVVTDDDFRAIGDRYFATVRRLAPTAAHITDKLTGNFTATGLIHLALPNALIIHTQRDPVDTCISCFSKLFGDGTLSYTYDLQELGRYYRHYRALMEHWHRVLPRERILDVQYEDVIADLEGQARRILAHCALDWDPACLTFYRTERVVRTVSAAQVRQPLYKDAVGRRSTYQKFLSPLSAELSAL